MKIIDLLSSLTITSNAPELIELPYTTTDKGRVYKLFDVLESEKEIVLEVYEIYEKNKLDIRVLKVLAHEADETDYLENLNKLGAFGKLYEFIDRDIKSLNAKEKLELQDALSELSEFFLKRSNESQDLADSKVHPKDIDAEAEKFSSHFVGFMKASGKLHLDRFGGGSTILNKRVNELGREGYVQGLKLANQDREDMNETASVYDQILSHLSTIAERIGISIMSRFERGDF